MSLSFRIISGALGGRILQAPKNLPARPTKNQVKESLFNILQHRLEIRNLKVLDLYCGLGSVSFEFASRGASVVCVDHNPGCIKFLNESAEKLNAEIISYQEDAFKFLDTKPLAYDLIFADPPYDIAAEDYQFLIDKVLSNNNSFKGLLVIEHSPKIKINQSNHCIDSRKYGSSCISIFQKPDQSE